MMSAHSPTELRRIGAGPLARSWAVSAVLVLCTSRALPQSLGCGGKLVGIGDTQATLVRQCGPPVRVQTVCAPRAVVDGWLTDPSGQPSQAIVSLRCAPAEDWIYDRGPGTFQAIVRVRDAEIESIRDGDRPR